MTDIAGGQTKQKQDSSELDEFSTAVNNDDSPYLLGDDDHNRNNKKFTLKRCWNEKYLSNKRLCQCCCSITIILLGIFLLILFVSIIPNAAQSSMDNSSLITLYLELSNPTNHSIDMNTTIQIINAGSFEATVDSIQSTLYYNNIAIGTFQQPEINIAANIGAIFTIQETIHILGNQGRDAFKDMTTKMLNGTDTIISFQASPKINIKLNSMKIASVNVNMNKAIIIPGTKFQAPNIKNFTIDTEHENATYIPGFAEIEFGIASMVHFSSGSTSMYLYDQYQNFLGIATMPSMSFQPGYNLITNISTAFYVCNCSNITQSNLAALQIFSVNWVEGINQPLIMRGPVDNMDGLVIADTMDTTAWVYGYCAASDYGLD